MVWQIASPSKKITAFHSVGTSPGDGVCILPPDTKSCGAVMAVTYGLLILKWKAYCQNWC